MAFVLFIAWICYGAGYFFSAVMRSSDKYNVNRADAHHNDYAAAYDKR